MTKELKSKVFIPENYKSNLSLIETEIAIKKVKDFFESKLAATLNLTRVSAPLFLENGSGLNDNLNGIERPVSFDMLAIKDSNLEIVHSLAKWKRFALHRYKFQPGSGLYTDMNAIRRDEELDNLHSIYVDQWDWEKVITKEERTTDTLKSTVRKIFSVFKATEDFVSTQYHSIEKILPQDITFVTAQELEDMYPELTAKERENKICKEFGCVFVMQIGNVLQSGQKHDGRAPDYDDWKLNGDLLFWYEPLQCALEISSMGIRVDEDSLVEQLKKENCEDRLNLPYHRAIINKELPYTIGGGIGQSRLCMLLLNRAHIGEVQASIWPQEMIDECENNNIHLL